MSDARFDSYIRINQRKPFKVVVCAITLVAFFVNTFAYDFAWAGESAPSELTSVGSDRATGPGFLRELDPATFKLPDSLGTIKDSWSPDASTLRRSQRLNSSFAQGEYGSPHNATVIHIQDAHCNYNAQTKIAEIVEYLNKEYGIETINLEGGAGEYDLSPFTDIKDKALRRKASDYFVKEGLVNGAEYFAVNNPEKVTLWGIEDPKLYVDNLHIYRNSVKNKEAIDRYLKSLSHLLSNLKTKIYSKELFEFDLKYIQYKASRLEFKGYLSYLIQKAKERSIDIKKLTDIYLLSHALDEESRIDFEKANNERDSLIDLLQKKLSKRMLEELVVKSVEFKADKISQKDYYGYLVAKSAIVKIDLKDFPELKKYIVYIAMYDAINKAKVMEELASLEDMVKGMLYRSDEERELSTLSKNLALLKNIFDISITRQDYEYYKKNEDSFSARKYISFITDKAPPYGITATLDGDITNLDKYRENMIGFYEYSLKRDKAFLKNLRLDKSAIIITGGFHTENLTELFKQQGISYISIMPNFRNEEGYECPYYKILSGEDKIRIREALPSVLKNALATPPQLCPLIDRAVNGQAPIAPAVVAPANTRKAGNAYTEPGQEDLVTRGLAELRETYPDLEDRLGQLKPGSEILLIGPGYGFEILDILQNERYKHLNFKFKSIGLEDVFNNGNREKLISLIRKKRYSSENDEVGNRKAADDFERLKECYRPGNIETGLPYDDKVFGAVILGNNVMEHIDDRIALVQHIYRVLKPGGVGFVELRPMAIDYMPDITSLARAAEEAEVYFKNLGDSRGEVYTVNIIHRILPSLTINRLREDNLNIPLQLKTKTDIIVVFSNIPKTYPRGSVPTAPVPVAPAVARELAPAPVKFAGRDIYGIESPQGETALYYFKTKSGVEYINTNDGMSISSDTGEWRDSVIFVDPAHLPVLTDAISAAISSGVSYRINFRPVYRNRQKIMIAMPEIFDSASNIWKRVSAADGSFIQSEYSNSPSVGLIPLQLIYSDDMYCIGIIQGTSIDRVEKISQETSAQDAKDTWKRVEELVGDDIEPAERTKYRDSIFMERSIQRRIRSIIAAYEEIIRAAEERFRIKLTEYDRQVIADIFSAEIDRAVYLPANSLQAVKAYETVFAGMADHIAKTIRTDATNISDTDGAIRLITDYTHSYLRAFYAIALQHYRKDMRDTILKKILSLAQTLKPQVSAANITQSVESVAAFDKTDVRVVGKKGEWFLNRPVGAATERPVYNIPEFQTPEFRAKNIITWDEAREQLEKDAKELDEIAAILTKERGRIVTREDVQKEIVRRMQKLLDKALRAKQRGDESVEGGSYYIRIQRVGRPDVVLTYWDGKTLTDGGKPAYRLLRLNRISISLASMGVFYKGDPPKGDDQYYPTSPMEFWKAHMQTKPSVAPADVTPTATPKPALEITRPLAVAPASAVSTGPGSWNPNSVRYTLYWAAPVETVVPVGIGFLIVAVLHFFGFGDVATVVAGALSASSIFYLGHLFRNREAIRSPPVIALGIGTAAIFVVFGILGLSAGISAAFGLMTWHYINNKYFTPPNAKTKPDTITIELLCQAAEAQLAGEKLAEINIRRAVRLLEKAQELQKGKEPVLALATTKEIVKAAIARLRIINTQPGEPIATTGPMPVAPEVVTGPVVAAPTTKVHTPLVTVETAAPVVEKAESRGKSIREVLEAQKPKTEAGAESIIMGLEDFGVIKDFLEFSIKKLKERGVLVESANAIYLLGWVLAEKGVPGARIGAIVQGICFSADPKESALKLIPEPSEKTGTMLDRYLNFLKSCTNERDMNIGPTVRIFLNLPDSYRGVLTEEEIGTALKLDLYLSSYSMSDTVPLDKKIRDEYLVNPSFTKLRSRLAEGAYDSQEVRAASAKDLVRAFLLNNRECIFWHSRNTIKAYEGKKYRSIDGVDYEVVPSKMHEWSDSPVKDEITRFMFTQMETLEKMAGSGEFARLLKESGFLTHTISGVQYIIPISTSQLLSGYRGQIVGDNSGARHLTPSLPLAIFYRSASRSAVDGKALPGDRDKSAVHEFDIALLILTGRGDRKVDDGETMAYKLTGKPLPDFARKRMLAIKDDDIVDDITRLRDQQFIEKRAKQNIYKIFGWFRDGLLVDTAEVSAAIDMLRKETADLSSADKAGFLKEYLTTVFGSLNEEAFAALATRYVPKTDNRTLLDELFQIKPQDISAHISLLDYLGMESDIRSGTFEDVDVSTVDLKDLRKAALPAAPATAITLYQGKVLSGGAGKTIPLVDYAWIEAGSYAYKVYIDNGVGKLQAFNKIDGENVPVAPEFSFDVGRVEPISVGRENGDYVIKSDGFLSRKHFSLRIISGAQGKYSLEIKDLISFHGTNILWRASEDRQTGVPVSDNGSLGLIETSLPSSTPADEGIIAHNIGRLKSAEMVNTINGESMNGNAGENRAGVFMNVDSLGRIHSINEVEDANVTLSIVVSNKHSRNIIEISRSSGLRELTAEARNNIIRAAVRCNMMKITSVGLPTIAEGDGIINVLTGSEIKILRLLGNDQALVRSTDSKKDIIDGIVSVPDIVRLFSTGQFTITGESSGIPETLQAVPAEPLPVVAEIPIDTVEARRADVVEAFKDANGRSTDVRVVQGVPKGGMPSALSVANGVSRTLAKNRYGVLDGTMQIYLFEMDPDDSEQTARDKIETAITNASKGLAATGRVVVFAPEMANGKRLGDSVKKGANITVLNDAYTDYEYPDMAARMALARNISSYYESPAAETLAVISRLLEKIAQGNFKLDAIDDLFRLTLRIKPVDYNRDIAFWKNAQLATAVAA